MNVHLRKHSFDSLSATDAESLEPFVEALTDRVFDTDDFADLMDKAYRNTTVMVSVPMSSIAGGAEFVFVTTLAELSHAMRSILESDGGASIQGVAYMSYDLIIRSETEHELISPVQFALKDEEEAERIIGLSRDGVEGLQLGRFVLSQDGALR